MTSCFRARISKLPSNRSGELSSQIASSRLYCHSSEAEQFLFRDQREFASMCSSAGMDAYNHANEVPCGDQC